MNNNRTIEMPARYEEMSDSCLRKCIDRRMGREKQRSIKAIIMTALAVLSFVSVFSTTAIIAGGFEKTDEQGEVQTVIVHYSPDEEMRYWEISEEEEALVIRVVLAVARGEGELTMQAVAQCIRNSCEEYGMTVEEVIEKHQWPTEIKGEVADEVSAAAHDAVLNVMYGIHAVNSAIHFAYNPDTQDGSWHENAGTFVCQMGSLRFFK